MTNRQFEMLFKHLHGSLLILIMKPVHMICRLIEHFRGFDFLKAGMKSVLI